MHSDPDTAQALHQQFLALHRLDKPLYLPNVWDAASARLMEDAGAAALATSSAAMAWSLGYADGVDEDAGGLPAGELLAAVQRMRRCTRLPLSVDVEGGYAESPEALADFVLQLQALGVSGINLEDGLDPPARLVAKITAIRARLAGRPLFINARCDVELLALATPETAEAECLRRLRRYAEAGADGLFVPGLLDTERVRRLAAAVSLPLNLMVPDPSDARLPELRAAGVRRFSCGPGLQLRALGTLMSAAAPWLRSGNAPAPGYAGLNALFSRA